MATFNDRLPHALKFSLLNGHGGADFSTHKVTFSYICWKNYLFAVASNIHPPSTWAQLLEMVLSDLIPERKISSDQ
jgi:hypothetical protein